MTILQYFFGAVSIIMVAISGAAGAGLGVCAEVGVSLEQLMPVLLSSYGTTVLNIAGADLSTWASTK